MRALLVVVVVTAVSCAQESAPSHAGSAKVAGRVVDQDGRGIAGVTVRLEASTGQHVVVRMDNGFGCGQDKRSSFRVTSASDGTFSADLPFAATRARVESGLPFLEVPLGEVAVTTAPLELRVRTIAHHTLAGLIVDAEGRPIAGAKISPLPPGVFTRTDTQGRFSIDVADDGPERWIVRRMGFRPLELPADQLGHVVLAQRRPLVTVRLEEAGAPLRAMERVTASRGGEVLSFCTAGPKEQTQEPLDSTCTLDAEPGEIELRTERGTTHKVTVSEQRPSGTDQPLEVTLNL